MLLLMKMKNSKDIVAVVKAVLMDESDLIVGFDMTKIFKNFEH